MKNKQVLLLAAGHMFTDLNQGALPAILPFLILEQGLSYTAAAGLIFAANFASSIIQPLFGYLADRISKPWLMPIGILLAGLGMAFTGLTDNYWLLFASVTVSGIGVAAFHPEGARMSNRVSGEKKGTGIGIFTVGGVAGFALGPLVATAAILMWGLKGTLVLIIPVVVMSLVLFRHFKNPDAAGGGSPQMQKATEVIKQADQWGPFFRLSLVVFCRSTVFYGLNTFIPLYWLHNLGQTAAASGTALTLLFVVGALFTLIGGRLADRFGYITMIRIGFAGLSPVLFAFLSTTDATVATMLLVPIGFGLFAPWGPVIVLGQKYLPNRMGLASGVTLGLAVSVGGVTAPALGWIADHHGLEQTLKLLAFIPILAAALIFTLPSPGTEADR